MARTKKAKPAVKKATKSTATKAVKKPIKAAAKATKPVKAKKVTPVAKAKTAKTAKATKKVTKVAKKPKAKKQAPVSFEKQLKESARQIKTLEKALNGLNTQVAKAYKQKATLQSKLANTGNKAQAKKLQAELAKLEKNLVKLCNNFEDTKTDVITAKLDAEQAQALLVHMDAFEQTWLDEIETRISNIVSTLPNLPEESLEAETATSEDEEEMVELDFEQDYPADITSDLESEMAD